MTTALSAIRALAADLPAVWSAATTTPADRQRIARLLLERVVVTVDKASERVDVTLHWVGGAVAIAHHHPARDDATASSRTTRGWSRGCGSCVAGATQLGRDRRAG